MITLKAVSILLGRKVMAVVTFLCVSVISLLAVIVAIIFMPLTPPWEEGNPSQEETARVVGGLMLAVCLLPFVAAETTVISHAWKSVFLALILIVSPLPMMLIPILSVILLLCKLLVEMVGAWKVEVQDIKKGLTREKLPQEYLLRPSRKPIDEYLVKPSEERIDNAD